MHTFKCKVFFSTFKIFLDKFVEVQISYNIFWSAKDTTIFQGKKLQSTHSGH